MSDLYETDFGYCITCVSIGIYLNGNFHKTDGQGNNQINERDIS